MSKDFRYANLSDVNQRRREKHQRSREEDNRLARERYAANREEFAARRRGYYRKSRANNPDAYTQRNRKNWLLTKYGLTHEAYEQLNEQQKGLCAICLRPPKHHKKLSVDHNHATGQVRGLLCIGCNSALGALRDSDEAATRLIEYLRKAAS